MENYRDQDQENGKLYKLGIEEMGNYADWEITETGNFGNRKTKENGKLVRSRI